MVLIYISNSEKQRTKKTIITFGIFLLSTQYSTWKNIFCVELAALGSIHVVYYTIDYFAYDVVCRCRKSCEKSENKIEKIFLTMKSGYVILHSFILKIIIAFFTTPNRSK